MPPWPPAPGVLVRGRPGRAAPCWGQVPLTGVSRSPPVTLGLSSCVPTFSVNSSQVHPRRGLLEAAASPEIPRVGTAHSVLPASCPWCSRSPIPCHPQSPGARRGVRVGEDGAAWRVAPAPLAVERAAPRSPRPALLRDAVPSSGPYSLPPAHGPPQGAFVHPPLEASGAASFCHPAGLVIGPFSLQNARSPPLDGFPSCELNATLLFLESWSIVGVPDGPWLSAPEVPIRGTGWPR